MSPASSIPQWTRVVAGHLPHLSRLQAHVLARWSWATVLLGSVGVTHVSQMLSLLCGGQASAWRQRLREWTYEASRKRGLIAIRAHLLRHHSLLVGCFRSFAWITNQPPPFLMASVFLASCIPKTYP